MAGADGSSMANGGSAQAANYVIDGYPIGGTHYEIGLIPSYTVREGRFKNTSIKFYYMHHHSNSAYYPDARATCIA